MVFQRKVKFLFAFFLISGGPKMEWVFKGGLKGLRVRVEISRKLFAPKTRAARAVRVPQEGRRGVGGGGVALEAEFVGLTRRRWARRPVPQVKRGDAGSSPASTEPRANSVIAEK